MSWLLLRLVISMHGLNMKFGFHLRLNNQHTFACIKKMDYVKFGQKFVTIPLVIIHNYCKSDSHWKFTL